MAVARDLALAFFWQSMGRHWRRRGRPDDQAVEVESTAIPDRSVGPWGTHP